MPEPTRKEIERMCVKLYGCTSKELNPDDRADARNDARTAIVVQRILDSNV